MSLIWISTFVDYFCGIRISETPDKRGKKRYLALSIFVNLALLGVFKYYNFFLENFLAFGRVLNIPLHGPALKIILPVGISFYTFQTMSYTIDIYYERIKPTRDKLNFALFVAFFPQLVAGPIERARHLLPQIEKPRTVSRTLFYEGCYLIFWGLFQKVFVADNLARIVDPVFARTQYTHGFEILIGLYAFAFQIFCDFAGYSNIARGLCKCMGFEIMVNFNLPYFARNPSDFWQRWHISLSTWIRDYLYIPLGGNRKGVLKTLRNLMVTMILGGLWHGAAWTFVFWGVYHGTILVVYHLKESLLDPVIAKKDRAGRSWRSRAAVFFETAFFFHVVCIGWLIFRAQSVQQVVLMGKALFTNWQWHDVPASWPLFVQMLSYSAVLLGIQMYQYMKHDLMAVYKLPWPVKSVCYYVLLMLLIIFGVSDAQDFIYFQF